jgi:hypothetical protein
VKVRYIVTWRASCFKRRNHSTKTDEWVGEDDREKLYVQPLSIGTTRVMQRGIFRVTCRVMLCQKVEVQEPLLRPAVAPSFPAYPPRSAA